MKKMFKKRYHLMNTFIFAILFGLTTNCFLKPVLSEEERLFEATPEQKGEEVPLTTEELTPTKEALRVKYINEKIPYIDINLDKLRDALKQAEPLTIELHRQDKKIPNGGGSISQVEVRGFHNREWIYISLTWPDVTKNERRISPQQFSDAAAIMFPVIRPDEISPEKPFSPRMGTKGKMVNILMWKADWEEDLGTYAGLVDVEDEYPRYMSKYYTSKVPEVRELEDSALWQGGGRAAGNLFSQPGRGRSVEELNAIGFGTLTSQEHQDAFGSASWQDGRWTIVIAKLLKTEDPNDTQLEPGSDTFINFAAWNGAEEDRNGQKSVSLRWHPIIIEK
jgi:hypothetical protein